MRVLCLLLLMGSLRAFGGGLVLDLTKNYIDGNSAPYNTLTGGDTLFIQSGARPYLALKNFKGLANRPLVIINYKGLVTIENATMSYGVSLQNCSNIKFSGAGTSGIPYGIKVNAITGVALGVGYGSTDYELERLELSSGVGPGILAKTDPDCSLQYTRDKFTSRRIRIHHNYIHHTGTEGMYIGSTYYEGQTIRCNGKDTVLLPHMSDDVRIYNNITYKTGWDGIQVSSSRNALIYNNKVEDDSQALKDFQMNGIILGKGTSGKCYNNFIKNGAGTGLISFAKGPMQIFNNIIKYPGTGNSSPASNYGMYIDTKYSTGSGEKITIINNLIIGAKTEAIRYLGDAVLPKDTIANNIIVDDKNVPVPAKNINMMTTEGVAINNKIVKDFSTLNYCDPINDDFRICRKRTFSGKSILFQETAEFPDFNGDKRIVGSDMDLGPTEFQQEEDITAINDQVKTELLLYPNPAKTTLNFVFFVQAVNDPKVEIEILNYAGQRVQTYPVELHDGENQVTLNVEALPSGLYLLRYLHDEQVHVSRFTKL